MAGRGEWRVVMRMPSGQFSNRDLDSAAPGVTRLRIWLAAVILRWAYCVQRWCLRADFGIGDDVEKLGGDYVFRGTVQSVLRKRSGVIRYVVEDDRGILHVFNGRQLIFALPRTGPALNRRRDGDAQ